MRITVLHNQARQANLICKILFAAKYTCDILQDTAQLFAELQVNSADLLLVHWPAFKGQGREVLRRVRASLSASMPVIFLASPAKEQDIFEGLTSGTMDYLLTPIRPYELITRIKICLNLRYPPDVSVDKVNFGPFIFDYIKKQIELKGRRIPVTAKEFETAQILMRNLGCTLSRATMVQQIWGDKALTLSRTLDTHISKVRNKLRLVPENGYRLSPIYGYGYVLQQVPCIPTD